jgi:bifunctional non-homologous end joining protein LigD
MAVASAGEQLSLAIDSATPGVGLPRLRPMRPVAGSAPFDDDEWFFEPWWPGTPALGYVEDGRLRLQIEHLADPEACFPELRPLDHQLGGRQMIVECTLLVLDEDGRPDAELLRRRLAQPDGAAGWPALVCSDLLHLDGRALLDLPFAQRRAEMSSLIQDGELCVVSRGLRGEGTTLAQAVARMGLTEIGARRLTGRYRPGSTDDSWLRLPVAEEPASQTRPLLTLLQKLPL